MEKSKNGIYYQAIAIILQKCSLRSLVSYTWLFTHCPFSFVATETKISKKRKKKYLKNDLDKSHMHYEVETSWNHLS